MSKKKRHFYYANIGMSEELKSQLFELADSIGLKPTQVVRMMIKTKHFELQKELKKMERN